MIINPQIELNFLEENDKIFTTFIVIWHFIRFYSTQIQLFYVIIKSCNDVLFKIVTPTPHCSLYTFQEKMKINNNRFLRWPKQS